MVTDGDVHAGAFTRNELLVPFSEPPVFLVAVMVKVPVLEMVTLCEARTPLTNEAVAPLPAAKVPVDVIMTLLGPPSKLVTVLPRASIALTLMLKAVPAVCVPIGPLLVLVTAKLANGAGFTSKLLLVPVCAPPDVRVAVIVKLPVLEIVTLRVANTPATNAGVVPPPAERVPVELMFTVLTKVVAVLLN